jgi:hypothetical protein
MAICGRAGHPQRLRRLLVCQAAEVAEVHELCPLWMFLGELVQGLVQCDQLIRGFIHRHFEFVQVKPLEIAAVAGDTINFTNKDFVIHTVTARDKSFDVVIAAHGTGTLTVNTPGAIEFYCRFHPAMKGKITVSEN